MGLSPQAAESKGLQFFLNEKIDILRVSRSKLLSRIRKLVVVFIEFHNLLGVVHCTRNYSPRGGKKKKAAMPLIINVQRY